MLVELANLELIFVKSGRKRFGFAQEGMRSGLGYQCGRRCFVLVLKSARPRRLAVAP